MSDLSVLESETLAAVAAAADEAALEAVRVGALGKKGTISQLLATLGKMPPDERKAAGAAINALKDRVTEALGARRSVLKEAALAARLASETIDVTLPVRASGLETGRIHPISQVTDELTVIFADMGFAIAEGPDIESDDYNFTRLNFPVGHPAREMHDTFFFAPDAKGERKLLRTHTSPVQVRTMLGQKPPIRVICPGRTYRCDSDQTHTPMFHQVEGLVIDRTAHLGHLKWILEEFCKAFFEVPHVRMRFRPSFFPFTEPSMEVDIQCRRRARRNPFRRGRGLAGDSRLRHGASQCAGQLRHRSRRVPGLCLGHGHRPHRHVEIWHAGSARLLRGGSALAHALRLSTARLADSGRGIERVTCRLCCDGRVIDSFSTLQTDGNRHTFMWRRMERKRKSGSAI